MCGTLTTPQFGQIDFGDAFSVHALATRLRVADCGDFLFGTGMIFLVFTYFKIYLQTFISNAHLTDVYST